MQRGPSAPTSPAAIPSAGCRKDIKLRQYCRRATAASCLQATSAKHYGEKDARLEYLSWRVWFMKRNRALAKEERRRRAALLAEDVSSLTVQDEETSHDGETSDDETLMPVTSTGSKGVSFDLEKKASQHLDKKRPPSLPKVLPVVTTALPVTHMPVADGNQPGHGLQAVQLLRCSGIPLTTL